MKWLYLGLGLLLGYILWRVWYSYYEFAREKRIANNENWDTILRKIEEDFPEKME